MPELTLTLNSGKGLQFQLALSSADGLYTLPDIGEHLLARVRVEIPSTATVAGTVKPQESHGGVEYQTITDAADADLSLAAGDRIQVVDQANGPIRRFGILIAGGAGGGSGTLTGSIEIL